MTKDLEIYNPGLNPLQKQLVRELTQTYEYYGAALEAKEKQLQRLGAGDIEHLEGFSWKRENLN